MSDNYVAALTDHYQRAWGAYSYAATWGKGPIERLPSLFKVLVFKPSPGCALWVYATVGMSVGMTDDPVELHILSPTEYCGHIELLTVVADYHCSGHPVGVAGTTVNFGRPWMPESRLTYGLISRPYQDGPTLEVLADKTGEPLVNCYWLLPITATEREFKKRSGLEQLEALFDKKGLRYADPLRNPVV